MTQKVLNKMQKYCKLEDLRFGQLVYMVMELAAYDGVDLFHITDAEFTKSFNKIYTSFPPKKDRGGYYPHGK